jgi:hypothetical protein
MNDCDRHFPDPITHILHHLHVLEELAVTEISDQQHLDTDVTAIVTATGLIAAEISALKAQPAAAALNFTGLDSAMSSLQQLAPQPAAPAPAVADTPPATTDTTAAPAEPAAPTDGSTPPAAS